MTRVALSTLILIQLACGLPAEQDVPNLVHVPTPIKADFYPVQTTGNVNIREVDGDVVGSLPSGSYLWVVCDGDWCFIRGTIHKVFRGCVSNNPDGLGCQSKP